MPTEAYTGLQRVARGYRGLQGRVNYSREDIYKHFISALSLSFHIRAERIRDSFKKTQTVCRLPTPLTSEACVERAVVRAPVLCSGSSKYDISY